jgi:ABC-type lipoprotein export system ATPase subunit
MIEIKNISKKFKSGETEFLALKDVSVTIPDKGITVISGPSGSGKSTLLSIIGLLQTPSGGEISFDGKKADYKDSASVRQYIRKNISYVFQEFNLVDDFSVEDNLLMVCSNRPLVAAILEKVGLSAKKQTPTKLLSGGEKQRLAIGRAIAKDGDIVLLDEPTGNLDAENGKIVFELLKSFAATKTIIVVTHDLKLAYNYADFVVLLNSGKIVSEFRLNSDRYTVDPKEGGFDSYGPLIDVLRSKAENGPLDIRVSGGDGEKALSVTHKNVLSTCHDIYTGNPDRAVTVEILRKRKKEEAPDLPFSKEKENRIFPAKYIFRYSGILFRNKLWKNIFSIFLLVLNIIMIFTYSCFASFDYAKATRGGFDNNDAYYATPYQQEANKVTGRVSRYFSGENLYSHLDENGVRALPRMEVLTDLRYLRATLVILDKPVSFRDSVVQVPDPDCAVVTDFITNVAQKIEEGEKKAAEESGTSEDTGTSDTSETSEDAVTSEEEGTSEGSAGSEGSESSGTDSSEETENKISVTSSLATGPSFNNYPLTISGTVACHAEDSDASLFVGNPNSQTERPELFLNEFSLIFVSEETYMNMMHASRLRLNASNVLGGKKTLKQYALESTSYAVYDSEALLENGGTVPSEKYDVVISDSLFRMNTYANGFEEISDCLDKEFFYKDLTNSPNRDLYQSMLNLHDITSKVRVVGSRAIPARMFTSRRNSWTRFSGKKSITYPDSSSAPPFRTTRSNR